MGTLLKFNNDMIDVTALSSRLSPDLIAPAEESYNPELAVDHTSEPIKSLDDIMMIRDYLINNKRYRDNMLFIVGINFGLRVSDLRNLRFTDLIDNNLTFRSTVPVFEIKTRNTRSRKHNRYITINNAVIEAVTLYLQNTPGVCLSDYMFRSDSNRNTKNIPIHRNSIDRILKAISKEVNLDIKMSTHTLRKTFCYHQMLMSNNDPRKLLLLSKIMGHSSVSMTMTYIGITAEEISAAYMNLNLGSSKHNYIDSIVGESSSLEVI